MRKNPEAFGKKKINEAEDFTFHWRCEATHTTHICFADNLLLFCGGSILDASLLKNYLFFSLSGMEANSFKGLVLVAGDNNTYINALLYIFAFPMGTLPLKYLGAPSFLGASQHLIAKL